MLLNSRKRKYFYSESSWQKYKFCCQVFLELNQILKQEYTINIGGIIVFDGDYFTSLNNSIPFLGVRSDLGYLSLDLMEDFDGKIEIPKHSFDLIEYFNQFKIINYKTGKRTNFNKAGEIFWGTYLIME